VTTLSPGKAALWQELLTRVESELLALERAQHETQLAATHEEAKPENDKDTRALEQSYLARGQAARVEESRRNLAALATLPLRRFDADAPIALGALVTLEGRAGAPFRVLLAPAGAGERLADDAGEVRVITAASPLGRALIGARVGETSEYVGPGGAVALDILYIE
jgi:transcription elongation GreA/GreB family factor